MLRRALLIPALAGLVYAQTTSSVADPSITSSSTPVATPDALPLGDLRDADIPTYTETPGLVSDIVYYNEATAVAAAAADMTADPLSVFPAVTDVPINAAGDDDSGNAKRGLAARSACDAQATMANYYSVNVDSYDAFKADPTISSVALAAPTPTGYFQTVKNAPGANSAYAYLGYSTVNKGKTGYDVNWCASKCTSMSGCLSFNIYFERDPTLEPGAGCENPAAFANIKCSFWGTALDESTANNFGQWRRKFQVANAGSNAYTSYKVGGPISGWNAPQKLDTSIMNAPLRDCSDTWTYLGYKLLQAGPYDTSLCAASCDALTSYNAANPPATGKPVKCAAFGSYILTQTIGKTSSQMGQMCTFYTSNYGKEYAVNNVAYDDGIGAKYTYSYSFFYSRDDRQPICKKDIDYLVASGSDFCTSFNAYSAPTVTAFTTSTPDAVVDLVTTTTGTSTAIDTAGVPTTTVTGLDIQWKRFRRAATTDGASSDTQVSFTTVANVPESSAVILAENLITTTLANGTVPTGAPENIVAPSDAPAKRDVAARAIATPASITSWPSSRIAEACSAVATGSTTTTKTTVLEASHTVKYVNVLAATTLKACAVPTQRAEYTAFTPIWGVWSGDTLKDLGHAVSNAEMTLQLPFEMKVGSVSSNVVTVGVDGYMKVGSKGEAKLAAFQGQGSYLYIYSGSNGIFYRITGEPGSRQFVVSWYAGTLRYGHMQNHFTITYFEKSQTVQYKYYDVVQTGVYTGKAYTVINGVTTSIVDGTAFNNGDQFQLSFDGSKALFAKSSHNRVDCCVKRPDNWFGGWHSCTEFQPAKEQSVQ